MTSQKLLAPEILTINTVKSDVEQPSLDYFLGHFDRGCIIQKEHRSTVVSTVFGLLYIIDL